LAIKLQNAANLIPL